MARIKDMKIHGEFPNYFVEAVIEEEEKTTAIGLGNLEYIATLTKSQLKNLIVHSYKTYHHRKSSTNAMQELRGQTFSL
ncbi:MAG: hypothetical protein OWS74_01610 [Firmicutes bacterium]|nr:hypothetical protein [Bacillota bacterium]